MSCIHESMNHSHLTYRSPFDVYIKVNGYIYMDIHSIYVIKKGSSL